MNNTLTTITDGAEILRCSGTFGRDKTIHVNHFGGVTYLHLKASKKNGSGWKTITYTLAEYKELVRMASMAQLNSLDSQFFFQNRHRQKKEREARKQIEDDGPPPKKGKEGAGPSTKEAAQEISSDKEAAQGKSRDKEAAQEISSEDSA